MHLLGWIQPCNGKITTFYVNGQTYEIGIFKNGYLDKGEYLSYHDNGQLEFKGKYKEGKRIGPWVGFDNNGLLSAYGVYDSIGNLISEYWFHDTGVIDELNIFDHDSICLKNSILFYNDGTLNYTFNRTIMTGESKEITYHENGNIEKIVRYKNGKKNGYTEQFDFNGELIDRQYFENGKLK